MKLVAWNQHLNGGPPTDGRKRQIRYSNRYIYYVIFNYGSEIWYIFPPVDQQSLVYQGPPHYRGFTIIFRHATSGRTPLDEWLSRLRDLYLTMYNTEKRQPSMSPAGFEPAIPSSERPQTHAIDRAATAFDIALLHNILSVKIFSVFVIC